MRTLVWWVQDHLGLAAVGVLGLAAVAVAVALVTSSGSSGGSWSGSPGTSQQPEKVAAGPSATSGKSAGRRQAASGKSAGRRQAAGGGSTSLGRRHRPHAVNHHRHKSPLQAAEAAQPSEAAKADRSSSVGKVPAAGTGSTKQQPTPGAEHSLDVVTADQVAAAHPGVECPKSYSRKQCEQAVEAAADPAPSTAITQPSDCVKAMSEAQCEELFAAEAAARAAGSGSISPQECMEHPEQEKCAAVVEEMELQYEAAHAGG